MMPVHKRGRVAAGILHCVENCIQIVFWTKITINVSCVAPNIAKKLEGPCNPSIDVGIIIHDKICVSIHPLNILVMFKPMFFPSEGLALLECSARADRLCLVVKVYPGVAQIVVRRCARFYFDPISLAVETLMKTPNY